MGNHTSMSAIAASANRQPHVTFSALALVAMWIKLSAGLEQARLS